MFSHPISASAKLVGRPLRSVVVSAATPGKWFALQSPPSDRAFGGCCHPDYYAIAPHGEYAFSMRTNNFKYGEGSIQEVGDDAKLMLDSHYPESSAAPDRLVVVFSDSTVSKLPFFQTALDSLSRHAVSLTGVNPNSHYNASGGASSGSGSGRYRVVIYDSVRVEPTSESFMEAARFFAQVTNKGTIPTTVVSIGGGSVMDTAKAALLYATHPPPASTGPAAASSLDQFLHYVNMPVGRGQPVPFAGRRLPPHIAIPTTSGTGSEGTGFAICKVGAEHPTAPNSKTGIASPHIVPTLAIIDPVVTQTLPRTVIASSGFDVLSHALESYTARPFTKRDVSKVVARNIRPLNQGANPYTDFSALEAIRIVGQYFERAVNDPKDFVARERMMFASMLAGTALGNAGTHLPHGLSYPVSGLVKHFCPPEGSGYPIGRPLVPHGMSVILCAPAAFRFTFDACPDRHILAAELLHFPEEHSGRLSAIRKKYNLAPEPDHVHTDKCGPTCSVNSKRILPSECVDALHEKLLHLMKVANIPNGLRAIGFKESDIPTLVDSCIPQRRVIDNAPLAVQKEDLAKMYTTALQYW